MTAERHQVDGQAERAALRIRLGFILYAVDWPKDAAVSWERHMRNMNPDDAAKRYIAMADAALTFTAAALQAAVTAEREGSAARIAELEKALDSATSDDSQFGPCQHPGCKLHASGGTPTPDGYKWLCYTHWEAMRTAPASRETKP